MANISNYYSVLAISPGAADTEIKAAYRRLAKKYHPDAHPGDGECENRFREINEAYSILGDSEKRKKYDEEFFGFRPDAKEITNEEKLGQKNKNPLDTSELFERFMGIRR